MTFTLFKETEQAQLQSRRNSLKAMAGVGLLATPVAALTPIKEVFAAESQTCVHDYNTFVDYRGEHQQGVITPDTKEASFIAFQVTKTKKEDLQKVFQILSKRVAFLTQPQKLTPNKDDRLPPPESGFIGTRIEPDSLTITVSVGASLFDDRFGLKDKKPKKLITMERFPNDRLQKEWCHGDIMIQFCANSRESVLYALRDIIHQTQDYLFPLWKMDGFLPARDIDRGQTGINLFGFKDGTGNGSTKDKALMDELVWVTPKNDDLPWCVGGSYQAVRLIRFNLEFWDRTPLEDQENDFGRVKATGAPIGKQHEQDDPEMLKDPHGDRILFDSHMRRAEPRDPERHVAKLRRRSFSYSLGVLPSGMLDMGLVFVAYQNDLGAGFISTQARLNGEPLERYIKPFGGGYYFVVPGMKTPNDYLGQGLFEA